MRNERKEATTTAADVSVLHDAARMLQVAARALLKITPGMSATPFNGHLNNAKANIGAASARLPDDDMPEGG